MSTSNSNRRSPKPDNWDKIYPRVIRAERDFKQLEAGDKILIGLSGGSDSLVLLDILSQQQRKLSGLLGISFIAAHIAGSYKGRPTIAVNKLKTICLSLNVPLLISSEILKDDIYSDCFKCSITRRKLLFDLAENHGCNKIALGHNANDLIETFLLNAFYSGKLAATMPNQSVLKGKLHIIRPLAYVWKEEIVRYSRQRFGAFRSFSCPGGRDSRRMAIRCMIKRLQSGGSPVKENILKAIFNPKFEYLPTIRQE